MIEIDKLVAGPELDALVAEKVMGWKPWNEIAGVPFWADDRGVHRNPEEWRPSTDTAAAMEVFEKMKARFKHVSLIGIEDHDAPAWQCLIGDGPFEADAPTAALAICRAALKAVGA